MTGSVPVPGPSAQAPEPAVADVLRELQELQDRPLPEHVEVFDGVHRALQHALASLDEA